MLRNSCSTAALAAPTPSSVSPGRHLTPRRPRTAVASVSGVRAQKSIDNRRRGIEGWDAGKQMCHLQFVGSAFALGRTKLLRKVFSANGFHLHQHGDKDAITEDMPREIIFLGSELTRSVACAWVFFRSFKWASCSSATWRQNRKLMRACITCLFWWPRIKRLSGYYQGYFFMSAKQWRSLVKTHVPVLWRLRLLWGHLVVEQGKNCKPSKIQPLCPPGTTSANPSSTNRASSRQASPWRRRDREVVRQPLVATVGTSPWCTTIRMAYDVVVVTYSADLRGEHPSARPWTWLYAPSHEVWRMHI